MRENVRLKPKRIRREENERSVCLIESTHAEANRSTRAKLALKFSRSLWSRPTDDLANTPKGQQAAGQSLASTSLQPSTEYWQRMAAEPGIAEHERKHQVLDYFLESDVVFSVSPIFGSLHIQLAIARYPRFEFSNFEFCVQRTKFAPLLRHASSIAAPTLRVIRTLSHQQFLPACQRTASEKHRTNVPRRPHQLPPFLSLQTTCILSRQRVLPRNRPAASVKSPPRLPRPPHQSWLSRLRVSINEVLQKLNSLSASELVGQF